MTKLRIAKMKHFVLMLWILLLHSFTSFAQEPGDFDEGDPDENPTDAPALPVDNGIYILLIAAISLGAYSFIRTKKPV